MSFSATVLTPNGRRHVVRCAPDTTLLQVLEQTCQKYEFKPEEYDLKHHNRIMDLMLTLRFSGLPNNAYLEMTPAKKARIESDVVLGLQLESGERLMGTFKPSVSLFDVLTNLVPDKCDESQNPVVIYMRKEVYGVDSLKQTTLKSLGLTSGRAIVRLVHRTPEQLKIQAHISTPLPRKPKEEDKEDLPKAETKEIEAENKIADAESNNLNNEPEIKEDDSNNIEDEKMEVDKVDEAEPDIKPQETIDEPIEDVDEVELSKEIILLGERNALVFSQAMANELPMQDVPEEFYNLTVPEVKRLYLELGKKRQELENAPLKTEALRSAELSEKMKHKMQESDKVILRIMFPDRTVLQGTFTPVDKIEDVREFVKSFLQNPDQSFDLYITPPKQILSPETTLYDASCVPTAIMYFGPNEAEITTASKYLKDEIMDKLTSPEAALLSAAKTRGIKKHNTEPVPNEEVIKSGKNKSSAPGASVKSSNVPKWFKMNK